MTASRIHRLSLTHFRNYRAASLQTRGDVVVLVGPNGAGKTNCIEAISFLSPGRGLRRATLDDVADIQGDGSWAVSAEVEGALGLATLGTGIDPPGSEGAATSRRCRIDREPVGSATAFGDHLRMVWLTPAMDGLFLGAASERRRFFDRLVLAIDSEHSSRVSALDRSLRSRNRLLEVRNYDDHWCDAIERETAELAVAVAAMRGQTVTRLAAMLRTRGEASAFPSAQIMLDGWMENALVNEPATSVEDRYREILRAGRARDAAAGRTLDGPHLTDLQVIYAPKNMPARDASTGEQKALLIGLVVAHATLVADMTGITPLLLLDEVVAHLDPSRRRALFDELAKTRRAGVDDRRRSRRIRRHRWHRRNLRCGCRQYHSPWITARVANPSPCSGATAGIRLSRPRNRGANRAFAKPPNQCSAALKNHQKIPFIQQLADGDFALGAWRLSWHK